jgi:hypothetical protein
MINASFRPLAHVGISGHESPGYPDFPRYTVDIVSAELPCGASWLASMFLECGAPIWNPWNVDMSLEWRHLRGNEFEYHYPGNPWSRVISGLVTGRRFAFNEAIVPRFSHDVPGHWTPSNRLILFVRDPRDALFSAWRRLQAAAAPAPTPFIDWLHETDSVWGLPRATAYLLHLGTWRHFAALSGSEVRIVRFEDVKTNGRLVFQGIQTFISAPKFAPSESEIDHALAASSFSTLQKIENEMIRDGVFDRRVNFAGLAHEYANHFDKSTHAAFGSAGGAIYRWLGYTAPVASGEPVLVAEQLPSWLESVRPDLKINAARAIAAAQAQFNALGASAAPTPPAVPAPSHKMLHSVSCSPCLLADCSCRRMR